jgi:hypothetical protein
MKIHRHPVGLFWALLLSIPFYFLWNYFAPIYAYQLPPIYQHLPFWHCAGLFVLLAILRAAVLPF